jgi:hypothetical protein
MKFEDKLPLKLDLQLFADETDDVIEDDNEDYSGGEDDLASAIQSLINQEQEEDEESEDEEDFEEEESEEDDEEEEEDEDLEDEEDEEEDNEEDEEEDRILHLRNNRKKRMLSLPLNVGKQRLIDK